MKKPTKFLITAFLTVSVLIYTAACSKNTNVESSKRTYQTFNTNEYNLVVPTGTVVDSDEPDLPENIVYWNPARALKEKYTVDEAIKKYAFIVGHSTLIYTACDELKMSHDFYCVDYGAKTFQNDNCAYFLGSDGKEAGSQVYCAYLKESDYSSFSGFTENLGWLYVGNMGFYDPEAPDAPQITIVEQTEDHVFATVKKDPSYSEEALFYAKFISGKLFYTRFQIISTDKQFTDEDRQIFVRYSALLFDHLSPDDGTEPYIYDKFVNIPVFGRKRITGFDHIRNLGTKSIELEVKPKSEIEYFWIEIDPSESSLAKRDDYTDWTKVKDMQVREYPKTGRQEFVFTIDGTRYLCSVYGRNGNKINVNSSADLIKLIEKSSFIK